MTVPGSATGTYVGLRRRRKVSNTSHRVSQVISSRLSFQYAFTVLVFTAEASPVETSSLVMSGTTSLPQIQTAVIGTQVTTHETVF